MSADTSYLEIDFTSETFSFAAVDYIIIDIILTLNCTNHGSNIYVRSARSMRKCIPLSVTPKCEFQQFKQPFLTSKFKTRSRFYFQSCLMKKCSNSIAIFENKFANVIKVCIYKVIVALKIGWRFDCEVLRKFIQIQLATGVAGMHVWTQTLTILATRKKSEPSFTF